VIQSGACHEVSFWHEGERRVGDLRLPVGAGPHPVVVLVRDDDRPVRDRSGWLDVLVDAGFGTFSWDRPAPGGAPASTAHRTREVLSAVERLALLPALDPASTVLMGWGAGGRAATRAVAYRHRIAGLILACTPVLPDGPGAPDGEGGPADAGADRDLRPCLSTVTAPVLALFGELDPRADARREAVAARAVLAGAGHPDHEVAAVRGADRDLRVAAPHGLGGLVAGRHRFGDWPGALTDLIVDWLSRRLRPEQVPSYAPPLRAPLVRSPARPRAGGAAATVPVPGAATAVPAGVLPLVPVRQVRRRVPR